MKLCFFTMSNGKFVPWARRLISSGDVVGRPIWYYRIPTDHPDPKRYKIDLLESDLLPDADKYVFLDADCILQNAGNWEEESWTGARDEEFLTALKYSGAFPTGEGWENYVALYKEHGPFSRLNSGVVALPGDIRKEFAARWREYNDLIDGFTSYRLKVRDQIGFGFAAKEFGLGALPDKIVGIPKREVVDESFSVIHASGKPNERQIVPYHNAVEKVLGGYLMHQDTQKDGYRWQVLAGLLLHFAENPTHPVMGEVGVFKGWNVEHMVNTFPGLRVHGADSREPPGPQKRHSDTDEVWEALQARYSDRITFQRKPGLEVHFDEPLDLIFDDSDHRTDMVIKHAEHLWPYLKMGGVYVAHDLDYKGTYYPRDAVRKAMDAMFPAYHTAADKIAWVVKQTETIPGLS